MAKLQKKSARVVDDDDDFDYSPEPKPRTSVLNLILSVLNVLGVGAFAYCLLLDLEKRQAWSYAVFLHDLAIWGLPLQEEDGGPSASRDTAKKPNLRSEQYSDAFQKRRTGVSVREPFISSEQGPTVQIKPQHLNDENLAEYFGTLGPIVKTLEEEVERLKTSIVGDIQKAGADFAAQTKAEEKRQKLEKVLLPLAANVVQARELDKTIRALDENQLDAKLIDAVQRRILIDILQPIEIIKPGDVAQPYLDKTGDLINLKLEDLQNKVTGRLANAATKEYKGEFYLGKEWDNLEKVKGKDTIEKRQNIALLLFCIAHVVKPDGTLLYEKGPERTQLVVGVREFNNVIQAYEGAERKIEERIKQFIREDREGIVIEKDGKPQTVVGFAEAYENAVQNIRRIYIEKDQAEKNIDRLKVLAAQAKKTYEDRLAQKKDLTDKLLVERTKTAKKLAELREIRRQLFQAQLELADAAEVNFRLEIMLRKEEGLKVPGGAKTP